MEWHTASSKDQSNRRLEGCYAISRLRLSFGPPPFAGLPRKPNVVAFCPGCSPEQSTKWRLRKSSPARWECRSGGNPAIHKPAVQFLMPGEWQILCQSAIHVIKIAYSHGEFLPDALRKQALAYHVTITTSRASCASIGKPMASIWAAQRLQRGMNITWSSWRLMMS